jgi:hypothetical protein
LLSCRHAVAEAHPLLHERTHAHAARRTVSLHHSAFATPRLWAWRQGKPWTLIAEPYPRALCDILAREIAGQVGWASSSADVLAPCRSARDGSGATRRY